MVTISCVVAGTVGTGAGEDVEPWGELPNELESGVDEPGGTEVGGAIHFVQTVEVLVMNIVDIVEVV